jgi:hypothetical protein
MVFVTNQIKPKWQDQIVKLVTKGELLGQQRSMISEEPVNLTAA